MLLLVLLGIGESANLHASSPFSATEDETSPVVTATETSTATEIATESATEIPSPTPTEVPTATPTMTPIPTASPFPTPTPTVDHEEIARREQERQNIFVVVFCLVVVLMSIAVIVFCIHFKRRMDEENNPEYTKAILGDDAFEFSQLEIL